MYSNNQAPLLLAKDKALILNEYRDLPYCLFKVLVHLILY